MPEQNLLVFEPSVPNDRASLVLDLAVRSPHPVNPLLFGKFCEHLGYNIYQGMEAQILYNPTFGKIQLPEGSVRHTAERLGCPDPQRVLESYNDGGALVWFRIGPAEQVLLSPDVGPHGNQAQRFETPGATAQEPSGIGQYTYLPLHRVRQFEFRVVARAVQPCRVELTLAPVDESGAAGKTVATAALSLTDEWSTQEGRLEVPHGASVRADGCFLFSLTTAGPANVVVDRVLLYPADHVHGADPEILRLLKQARLPILRWPGGNFVSAYHWRDGVGPVDARPTMPNPVWHGVFEPNLFGTDEFIRYCRDVGCEPLICINAGNGTPDEAAAWVEYCNGSPETPMGRLRAENGHPEPYRVKYWEIGNEIFGRHQVGWTTPAGHVDRFGRFRKAMQAADPTIRILACGGLHLGVDAEWNQRLNRETGGTADLQTHHILEGGHVDHTVDVQELYHAFMGYAIRIGQDYRLHRQRMLEAGIREPCLAITELQLFAFVKDQGGDGYPNPPRIPTPATISEALYLSLLLHECIRLGEFVEMITHTGTVNHGGGLRKSRQRVWGNPVHYAHEMWGDLAGWTPVGVRLSCGTFSTRQTFGHLPVVQGAPNLDAMAVLARDESGLTLMLVHRSADAGPIDVAIDLGGFRASPEASVRTLAGETLSDQNTLEEPERVVPRASSARVEAGRLRLTLSPYSLTRVEVSRAG